MWLQIGELAHAESPQHLTAIDLVNSSLLLIKLKCYGIAPSVINRIESYIRRRSFQVSVNGSLSQVAEAASEVPQGSVLGPILFVIYVNELSDNLTIDHLLYANDVKLIAPRKQSDALQSSLLASSKWSEDWEFILNPSESENPPLRYLQSCYIQCVC